MSHFVLILICEKMLTIYHKNQRISSRVKKIFMNRENSKTNEPHEFVLNLSQRLDLRSSDIYVALQNLSIY